MSEKYHSALERTSPKGPGQKFIGYCRLCGLAGLTHEDMREEGRKPCTPNIDRDQMLIDAIDGDEA